MFCLGFREPNKQCFVIIKSSHFIVARKRLYCAYLSEATKLNLPVTKKASTRISCVRIFFPLAKPGYHNHTTITIIMIIIIIKAI